MRRTLACAAVLVCGLAACGSRAVAVTGATLEVDGRTLDVGLSACPADGTELTVEQDGRDVVLHASARGPDVGDCQAGGQVVLDAPLGARRVLDGNDGAPVEVAVQSVPPAATLPPPLRQPGATTGPSGGPAYVTPAEEELIEELVAFARHPKSTEPPTAFATDRVALGLGDELLVHRAVADLRDPASWRLDPGAEVFRGSEGPFSALERIAENGGRQLVAGRHRRCASSPTARPSGLTGLRQVSVQPASVGSCLDWWSVDLFLDADGTIRAVVLDLWEP